MRLLLERGADPLAIDDRKRDALMLAVIARKVECAKILAPRSNPRARDVHGRCALALAVLYATYQADAELLSLLWAPGAGRWRDVEGKTAGDCARANEMPAMAIAREIRRSNVERRWMSRGLGAGRASVKRALSI